MSLDYDASLADPAFQVKSYSICCYSNDHHHHLHDQDQDLHHLHHWQEESVRLPDGNMIVMGQQKFSAPEIIFQVILNYDDCGDLV